MRKTPEGQIKEDIKKFLEASGFYLRSIVIGQIPGRKNPSKGIPDYMCIKRGRVIFFEVKTKTGVVSEDQEKFILNWTSKGGEAYVVRSVEDVQKVLKGLGLDDKPISITGLIA